MSLFKRIFGPSDSSNKSRQAEPDQTTTSHDLLKRATQEKKNGDLESSINTLKEAFKKMQEEGVTCPPETFLRLPKYLLAAGRNDEAWSEFNRAISSGINGQRPNQDMVFIDHSMIYSAMSNQLKTEKKYFDSTAYYLLSSLLWSRGMIEQGREANISIEDVKATVEKILAKSKESHLVNQLMDEYSNSLSAISTFQSGDFIRRLRKLANSD